MKTAADIYYFFFLSTRLTLFFRLGLKIFNFILGNNRGGDCNKINLENNNGTPIVYTFTNFLCLLIVAALPRLGKPFTLLPANNTGSKCIAADTDLTESSENHAAIIQSSRQL
jgi:hypothetical protein